MAPAEYLICYHYSSALHSCISYKPSYAKSVVYIVQCLQLSSGATEHSMMDISCSQEGERKVKLVANDDHRAVTGSIVDGANLPTHMISVTPSLDNTILLRAGPHIQMLNYNQINNGLPLQDNSLLLNSNSRGSRSKCLGGGHVDKHDETVIIVSYKECLRNHAASVGVGRYAIDGCGEFMASGNDKEGATLEALNCSACNCHRNFHRRVVMPKDDHFQIAAATVTSKVMNSITTSDPLLCPSPTGLYRSRVGDRKQYVKASGAGPYNNSNKQGSEEPLPSHHQAGEHLRTGQSGPKRKKRFRSSFTNEQKVKMIEFGKRVGWKIQKQNESGVLQLCEEIGVNRRVLKVWMHNNKHNYEGRKHHASPTIHTTGSCSGSGKDAFSHQE